MADVTSSIGTGGDYTTIQAWETAKNGDLVTDTERQIGEMKSEAFGAGATINGSTTNSSFYMWLRAVSGAEFDHTDGTGARVVITGSASILNLVTIQDDNVRVGGSEGASSGSIGFKYVTTNSDASFSNALRITASSDCLISQLVCYESSTAGIATGFRVESSGSGNVFTNCLIYDLSTTDVTNARDVIAFNDDVGSTAVSFINCVVHNLDATGGDDAFGFFQGNMFNCYAGGLAANDVTTGYVIPVAGDYNGADDTSTSVFTNNLQSKAASNQFVSVTGGSEDYHLKTGADCIDAGNDAHTNDFDIDGSFAGTRDDIGIHEFVAAGGVANPWYQYQQQLIGAA